MILVEDRHLLDAFRQGRRQALERVYMHYANSVYGLLKNGFAFQSQGKWARFRGYYGEHEVEECMQEVFRRAFTEKARLAYDGLRPYKSYLMMIARHHVLDQLRKKRIQLELTDDNLQSEAYGGPQRPKRPDEVAAERELRELMNRFRSELSEEEQQIFEQRFARELDQAVVAEALSLSVYKVRKVERILRKRLLVFLKKAGYMPDGRISNDSNELMEVSA